MVGREIVLEWSVNYYPLDASSNTTTESPTPILFHMVDSYINEQKPSDGEIFRRIRLYRLENKVEAERKWWARLDNSKPKDLRQLFKRREIISGFDRLLEMPGLWAKVQLGALHRLLTLKCDEVCFSRNPTF